MKLQYAAISLIVILSGCGLNQAGKNSDWDTGRKIIIRYPNGQKKSENDFKGVYTEWYPNGQIKFKVSQPTGYKISYWFPIVIS